MQQRKVDMATVQADMASSEAPAGWLDSLAFAKKRQFAWKTALLAAITLALVPVMFSKSALAAQAYVVALVAIHLGALAVFAKGVQRKDLAPSRFGLFWRATGLAVMVALLMMIRLDVASAWFWPSLLSIWGVHTAGLTLLHVRAKEGAGCPFLPRAWQGL
ncbi:MAG: hypothetical protein ACRDH5_18590 [bacterium]